MLVWAVFLFPTWLILAPHSATRFYARLYRRTHGSWYPQALRVGGVVLLMILMILTLTGVLK